MISVLIPTKNEEKNLSDCLRSVNWTDDIHVYDDGSTDATHQVARAANVHLWVAPRPNNSDIFGGDEAAHRNWALKNIHFKYSWVLLVDADERVTDVLAKSMQNAIQSPGRNVAFFIRRRDFFLGQWLKHVQATTLYLRLFRPDKMSFQRLINPVSLPDGPIATIDGYLDHFPFSKGIAHWLARHNSYSTLEALQIEANRKQRKRISVKKAFLAPGLAERRFHQKELFYRLPARPLLKFLLLYIAKGGFLDGQAGFIYAVLQSIYEYMIVLKTREFANAGLQTIALPAGVAEHAGN